jgi:ABC-type uncharacterized transport system auxiliary subunit
MKRLFIVGVLATTLMGCAIASNESGKNTTTSVGSGCAVNVISHDSYQIACADSDASKLAQAVIMFNVKKEINNENN